MKTWALNRCPRYIIADKAGDLRPRTEYRKLKVPLFIRILMVRALLVCFLSFAPGFILTYI